MMHLHWRVLVHLTLLFRCIGWTSVSIMVLLIFYLIYMGDQDIQRQDLKKKDKISDKDHEDFITGMPKSCRGPKTLYLCSTR